MADMMNKTAERRQDNQKRINSVRGTVGQNPLAVLPIAAEALRLLPYKLCLVPSHM
jgi:hypothetical protein